MEFKKSTYKIKKKEKVCKNNERKKLYLKQTILTLR